MPTFSDPLPRRSHSPWHPRRADRLHIALKLMGIGLHRAFRSLAVLFVGSIALSAIMARAQAAMSTQQPDCSDPVLANSAACNPSGLGSGGYGQSPQGIPAAAPQRTVDRNQSVYIDSAGEIDNGTQRNSQQTLDRRNLRIPFKPDPLTDFQRLAHQSTGQWLPIFGQDLFRSSPTTFAPADRVPVMADYIVGPGDEILLRVWGHDNFNSRLTVDRTGSIYIPEVGAVHVAGERFEDLQAQLTREVGRSFRNFQLSVNLGQLRSIQVIIVGEARRPGTYTVSSLSTLLNAILVSGGPTVDGSLRNIEIRRNGQTVTHFDLYDLAIRGDKSKDVRLEPQDVIFFPVVGPQIAVAGSVRHPAIFEIKPGATVEDALTLAGGLAPTASDARIALERIDNHHLRQAMSVALDETGRATTLRDGDVLHINPVLDGYQKSVTIRGNLANPGRFPWHEGMRLSEIIPDRPSLLTNNYWRERNLLGVPTPLFEPLSPRNRQTLPYNNQSPYGALNRQTNGRYPTQSSNGSGYNSEYPQTADPNTDGFENPQTYDNQGNPIPDNYDNRQQQEPYPANNQSPNQNPQSRNDSLRYGYPQNRDALPTAADSLSRSSLAEQQQAAGNSTLASQGTRTEVKIPAPEIDWSYAVIERLNPDTLKSSLVPFNLGRLVMDHDASQDLPLQPGDVVTILSQSDVHVSQDEQTKYVRLEGEFVSSGIYSVGPNETLADLVRRAGGFTSKAYLFGASFTRDSARILQQQRLDEYVSALSVDLERSAAIRATSSTSPLATTTDTHEQSIIAHLRQMRATGRIVLEFKPNSSGIDSVQAIPLENGDVFRVPSRPIVVSVVGSVYGQNIFLFDPNRRIKDYLTLAGKPNRVADKKHSFIIRADGSIFSKDTANGLWGNTFDSAQVHPGDTIVVPEKPIKPSALRDVIDWSQVFSQFAIGAAAIQVIK